MKRLLLSCLLVFVLLSGCASLQVKREVIDNTFYSSPMPKIQIKVSPEFKYIGESKLIAHPLFLFSPTMLDVFVDSEGSRAKRVVAIIISRVKTQFSSDLYTWVENYYEKGTCKLGGRNFQYCSQLAYPSLSSALYKFITDEGYVLPQCVLIKLFARVYGAERNIVVFISYIEEIPNLPYDCTAWNPDHPLLEDQRAYLEQFNKSCESSFAVLQRVPEPYRVIFTTGLEDKKPINDLTAISINEKKRIYIFVEWCNLKQKKYKYEYKVYDGAGKPVYRGRWFFTPEWQSWNTWTYVTVNKHAHKPGTWRFEIYLDGEKLVDRLVIVLPES